MKVAYVVRSLAIWGGFERVLVDKANALAKRGVDVTMITADQGRHPVPYTVDSMVKQTDLQVFFHHQYRRRGIMRILDRAVRVLRYRQRLRAALRTEKPDIVVTSATALVSSVISCAAQIPVVVECHTICSQIVDTGLVRPIRKKLLFRALRKAACLVTLTPEDAQEWRRFLGDRVCCIPNILHPFADALTPLQRHRSTTDEDGTILFVGRLAEQKGINHLLNIWKRISALYPSWHLRIVGDGELRQEVETLAAESPHIELLPPTEQIAMHYLQCDILALTSRFEPFGLVLTEAMSCSLPVVSFDSPYGPRNIINSGTDGVLVENGNDQAFISALSRLISSPDLRQKMGAKAAESVGRFMPENVIPQWLDLFNRLQHTG